MTTFSGRCHCGNLQIVFETGFTSANLPLRACQCSFCRAHGAVSAADPKGVVTISVTDPAQVRHYRFGFGITDFLICAHCGVYMAGVMEIDGALYASINANVLAAHTQLHMLPQPADYEGETVTERRVRRRKHWTPAIFAGMQA